MSLDSAPLFITFEGGEGAGKTTQIKRLAAALEGQGKPCLLTREPGGTPEGAKLRALLVERDGGQWSKEAETLLFFADRQLHVERVIKPALQAGQTVICDRFTDSTRAYQGYGHRQGTDLIETLVASVLNGFEPDITFLLDIDPKVGLTRAGKRMAGDGGTEDRFENLDLSFHERLRDGFLDLAAKNTHRFRVIDAAQDEATVFAAILKEVGHG
ncbi:MAG: dTMP kinase [Pseudobdellovibrionaceae bacterium]